jgi:peptide/nickel transport system permease protein
MSRGSEIRRGGIATAAPESVGTLRSGAHPLPLALIRSRVGTLGLAITLGVTLMAVCAPLVSPADPLAQNIGNRLVPPRPGHWAGTDQFGRDILSRIVWGSRPSLLVGMLSVVAGVAVGGGMGALAGYWGGRVDQVLMRIIDILMAFPALLLAIIVVAMLGTGLLNLVLAVALSNIPHFGRVTRGEVLRVRVLDFIEAAQAVGASHTRVIWKHVLPNVITMLVVLGSLRLSIAILSEASLSFLGLGIQPPTASWGTMVSEGRALLLLAPWVAIAPGAALALLVLGLNLAGDALRDALDPRLQSGQRR